MSRYRLCPPPAQEAGLLEHCRHARFVWNLAVEQHTWWTPRRGPAPRYLAQARRLTGARAANPWLAAGSQTVQQQALRDFAQAMANFFDGTHQRPTWCKAWLHEGFRIVGVRGRAWEVRRLSRRTGEVRVPKVGWVRFRWSRPVPGGVKSFRVTRDRAGRLLRRLARARPGSNRRARLKAGLNRGILAAGWGRLVARLEHKAPGRLVRVHPAYTSQTCNACGHRADADVNAARNIRDTAVGRTVAARGGGAAARPVNREPQPTLLST